uniref:Large ribosomal subunit protein uL22m n=1 Tax=Hucho hucho TaxID=62062 RepID=A0A4W5MAZ3_9TELE
ELNMGYVFIGFTLFRSVAGQIRSRLFAFGKTQELSCIHTSASLDVNKNWDRKNLQMFPPQQPDEARRPAEVHHCRRQIKYSKDKMWYLANMVSVFRCLPSHDVIRCCISKVLLEAQEMAVRNHNVEYKSNLYVAESFSNKGKYLKRIRYHGRGMFGIMDKVHCHYFVKLVEGLPPKAEQKTGFDQAKEYVEQLKCRTIIHAL